MPQNDNPIFARGALSSMSFGLGAVAMYLLDPNTGARRRALTRDKLVHYGKLGRRQAGLTWHDLSNRTRGRLAWAQARFRKETVSDDVLVARCASKIGRLVSNSHPIGITAEDGVVYLSGPVFADELPHLLHTLSATPGVLKIESSLEPHRRTERVQVLQNHRLPPDLRPDSPRRLTPTARLFVGLSSLFGLSTGFFALRSRKAA